MSNLIQTREQYAFLNAFPTEGLKSDVFENLRPDDMNKKDWYELSSTMSDRGLYTRAGGWPPAYALTELGLAQKAALPTVWKERLTKGEALTLLAATPLFDASSDIYVAPCGYYPVDYDEYYVNDRITESAECVQEIAKGWRDQVIARVG